MKYSKERVKEATRKSPPSFRFRGRNFEVSATGCVIVYDDTKCADLIALELGVQAKHTRSRFDSDHWQTFSIVPFPTR